MSEAQTKPFRAHDRRKAGLAASIAHPLAGWRVEGRVHDIGLGGAAVDITEVVEPGDRVMLELMAPTLWDPLHVRGRVTWAKAAAKGPGVRCGVSFEHVDPPSLFALVELLGTLEY
ncbi:MAG: PilZ domain-containing protein [Polyangiaceae bacterium]